MASVAKFDKKGIKEAKKALVDKTIFGVEINDVLIAQALRVYFANQRGHANTKIRSEVSGGGKKLWANNKVGKARTSSLRNPIWKGGGVVFGPRTERNYKLKLTKKMRAGAFRSALSLKVLSDKLGVIEEISIDKTTKNPTKTAEKLFSSLPVQNKVLVVLDSNDKVVVKSINNLKGFSASQVSSIDIFKLMNSNYILITEKSLEKIVNYWGGK